MEYNTEYQEDMTLDEYINLVEYAQAHGLS